MIIAQNYYNIEDIVVIIAQNYYDIGDIVVIIARNHKVFASPFFQKGDD